MRILRRALVPPAFLVLAVLAQVTIVNRLPLPGGARPDLVLLVVAALAVAGGPVPGMLAGFVGGLALDLAPPVSHLAGESAFVFCAAGYACGLLAMQLPRAGSDGKSSAWGTRDPGLPVLASLPVMVAGVGLAEALRAGLGLMLSDPRMTGPAIEHVLPAVVVYDVLFCPLVLWLVAVAMGSAEPASAVLGASEPKHAQPGRAVVRAAGAGDGTLAGRAAVVPRLTFAGTRQAPLRAPVPAPPKLRLAAHSSPSLARTNRSTPAPSHLPRGAGWLRGSGGGWQKPGPGQESRPVRVAFGSGSRDGFVGGSALGNRVLGNRLLGGGLSGGSFSGALGPSLFAGPGRRSTRKPRRNWLRASGGYSVRPRAGNARLTSGGTGDRLLAGHSVRPDGARGLSRTPGKGWLQPAKPAGRGNPGRRPASPGEGWIRARGAGATGRWGKSASWSSGSPGRRSSPGKGWIRPAKPVAPARRKSPGRGWLERKPARIMWQPKTPGKGWLSRGSGRWRSSLRVRGTGTKTLGPSRTRIGGPR
jgi:hypothetical protein